MDIQTIVGQRLAIGFSGTSLPADTIELIRDYKIGNLILFRENIESSQQLWKLCQQIQETVLETTGFPAFICIDQEGGMVSRLSPDTVRVPGNMAVAAAGGPEAAYRMACITARQLRGTGVNFNLAPVVDVNSNPKNPVIGMRSFGDDPERVAAYAAAAVRGYHDSGVCCCAKHFPGHGDTTVDSHIGLPMINKSLKELQETELVPFRAVIEAGVPAIMSSHILFPRIEPDGIPATMSRRIMHDLLRNEMGFEGLILSDDMEMDAIRKRFGTARGSVEAIKAGIDLVFVCKKYLKLRRKFAEAVTREVSAGIITKENLESSCERILKAKEKFAFTTSEPEIASHEEDFTAARKTACDAAVLFSGQHLPLSEDTFFCGPQDYRMTDAANAGIYETDFVTYMRTTFSAPGCICSVDPQTAEIAMITEEAQKHRNLVLGTCNAHLFRGQLALAESLKVTGLPLTIIALRNPYDLAEISEGPTKVSVFDYSADGLYAAEQFLQTGSATGRMPVKL